MVVIIAVVAAAAVGVFIFNSYTQEQLYKEACSQLTEITGQLFEKLTVQLDIQWGYLEKLDDSEDRASILTEEEMRDFLEEREESLSPLGKQLQFIAVDERGYYYTSKGRQGLWTGAEDLKGADRKSFLTTDWITNENQMVFARKLENPLHVDGNSIAYFVLIRSMDDMSPFFRSSAFRNRNTTYVIDANGTKMFSDTVLTEINLEGRNLFHAMRDQEYPHEGTFDNCLEKAEETTFICTDVLIDQNSYYMAMKKLAGYDWSMLILVPAGEVALSTRTMINSMIRVFSVIMLVLLIFSVLSFFLVTRFRKNQELLALTTRSEEALAQANRKLEVTNRDLEDSNKKLAEAQSAIAEALAAAKTASKAKSDFLANMSHDIRTPMNAIIGMTALIEHDADQPAKVREYTGKINNSSQHLLGLINEVLDMSKIESGKVVMNVGEFHLAELLEQVETSFRPQMEAKKQKFTVEKRKIAHEWLLGDRTRVLQILNNLLSNALKYTPEGGTILLGVEELTQKSVHYAKFRFWVKDNGIGMSKAYVEKIFDSFSREESSVTNVVQGTGLGMAIVKNLVDLMGGSINVESTQGEGSCFEVVLDFKISENEKAVSSEKKQQAEEELASLKGLHFLCAEDNELNAEILNELLEIEGASCEICGNGQLVLERFEKSTPGEFDMILMDIQMPVMNGYEATKAIRKSSHPLAKTIPIVAMTANAFSEDVQNSINAGMDAHISKPVDMKLLRRTIQNVRSKAAVAK